MRTVVVFVLLLVVSLPTAWSQALLGSAAVSGTIVDRWGDGIPDTTVVVTNEALGFRRTMITTDDGFFYMPDLAPAPGYRVRILRRGFQTWLSEEFQVYAGRTRHFRIPLTAIAASTAKGAQPAPRLTTPATAPRPGNAQGLQPPPAAPGTVRSNPAPSALSNAAPRAVAPPPTPQAPAAPAPAAPAPSGGTIPIHRIVEDLGDSEASLITSEQLANLPLRKRQVDELAVLEPAVNVDDRSGSLAFRALPGKYAIFVDSVRISPQFTWDRNATAGDLAVGSVREVQVLSDYIPAEFGGAAGGFVNTVTRSAGNSVHGDAYGYLLKPALGSEARFGLGNRLWRADEQAGASVGGPARRNKLLLFANVDTHSGRSDNLNRIINPLITDSLGMKALSSNCKAAASLCAPVLSFVQSQMNVAVPANWHANTGLVKADLHLGGSNTFHFEAQGMNSRVPNGFLSGSVSPNGGLLGNTDTKHQTRFGKIAWTALPTFASTNELRLTGMQDYLAQGVSDAGLSTGALGIVVAGTPLGATNTFPNTYRERRLQLVDNLSVTTASHVVKVGMDYSKTFDRLLSLENWAGTYYYSSLTALAQDFNGSGQKNYTNFTQRFGNPQRSLLTRHMMVYGEDVWRAMPRLTFDVGVRWEKPYITQPNMKDSFYYNTGTINSTNINLAPRLGAALRLTRDIVVRAGYGSYHDPHPGELLDALFLGNNLYQTNIWANPNVTGAPAFPKLVSGASIPTGMGDIFQTASKLRNPYVQEWNLSIERQWNSVTTVTLAATHNRGIKLWSVVDLNLASPNNAATYGVADASGQLVRTYQMLIWTTRNDPSKARVFQVGNFGSSWYDELSLQVRRRISRGLSVRAFYAWSHALDDVSGPQGVALLPANTWPGAYGIDKGNASADQRHRGVVDWTWTPTVQNGVARYLVNGWQASGSAFFGSPQGTTPMVITGGQQISGLTMAYTTSMNGSGGWSRVPFGQVNSLKNGALYEVNARLARNIAFSERVRASLALEGLNLVNHQRITQVYTGAYTVSSAILRPISALGQGIASQGYPGGTTARTFRIAVRLAF